MNALSSRIASGNGAKRCEARTSTSTGWLMLPRYTIEASAASSSRPRLNEPDSM